MFGDVTATGTYVTRARRTSSVDPTGYICLAGTGCGILRASLEILGALATQRYELLADTVIDYIPDGAVVCYEVASESSLRYAMRLVADMTERDIPTVLVGMKLARGEDPRVIEHAEEFVAQTPKLNSHIQSCSPLCRIAVSNIYLTIAVMTIDKKVRTPPRRRSSTSSYRSCSSNASSDTNLMSFTSLTASVHSLPSGNESLRHVKSSVSRIKRKSTSKMLNDAARSLSNLYERLNFQSTN